MTATKEMLDAIFSGQCDDDLDEVIAFAKNRKNFLQGNLRFTLNPGDEVKFSDSIRPKYLIGLPATVAKTNRTTVSVDCPDDPAYGRYQGSKGVRCPLDLIEVG